MRGSKELTLTLFGYINCGARVPPDHPLQLVCARAAEALDVLSPEPLHARLSHNGGEQLLREISFKPAIAFEPFSR